ncbi:MAG: 5'-nucleotidase C-terminal domain-containing protein, partial [Oscillibacter sp.]|nr:5'-nucleotidase C-terminal domain-containing protein [Oscillibacter sp.]
VNTVLPFGNTLSIVKVTGTELLEALEASTYCTPDALGGFPQVSGIMFTVDTAKAYDAGSLYPDSTYHAPKSINRVTIQSVGGKAFDAKAVYTIATNDFMAAGGDTYYAFKTASANYDLGVPMDEVLMDYITTELKGVVGDTYAKPQGRITVVKAAAPAEEPAKPVTPPAVKPAEPAADGGETSYTVVSGDCLWNISYHFYGAGAKFTRIASANGLKPPYLINIGQVLVIPAA